MIILITLAFVIIFGREIIVQLLFGSGFSGVTSLLTYVSFLPLFIGLTNMYGWQGLYIMNRERTMSYISLFVGILSISCLLMLIERFGLKGVLIIRNISEVIIFSLAYFFFQKFYKSEQNKSKGVA